MSEKTIDEEAVRREHLEKVKPLAQWIYLVGVLGGGTLLMIAFIALLAGSN